MPRAKYRARPCVIDGIRFASQREARRYQELRVLQRCGEIVELEPHPSWPLLASDGSTVGKYTADFLVVYASGEIVVEDVKSAPTKTTSYRLRKKLFEACHAPLTIREVE